jgi:hypothetical protein
MTVSAMQIIIAAGGAVRAVYSEQIDLAALGRLTITRASHVEPDEHGHWYADMTPVNGPSLGPFAHRSEALDAEQEWLVHHWLESGR